MKTLLRLLIFFFTAVTSAQDNFPSEVLYQFKIDVKHTYENDYISLKINNSNKTAVRLNVFTDNTLLNSKYNLGDTITIAPLESKSIKYYIPNKEKFYYYYNTTLGDPEKEIKKNKLALPFPKGKKYTVIQGNAGTFSHNNIYNLYAIDFDLQINDTICSADYGIIVGVINEYKHGGSSQIWKDNDRANFITIYHPHSGLYTQYYHLVYHGNLVKIGDRVSKGQPIGLSGNTGFSTEPHLHFNVLIPKKGLTLVSTPFFFENDIDGTTLKTGTVVNH